jgi:DUF971 family protein
MLPKPKNEDNSMAIQRAIFDAVLVHKFGISGHGFFALVALAPSKQVQGRKTRQQMTSLGKQKIDTI